MCEEGQLRLHSEYPLFHRFTNSLLKLLSKCDKDDNEAHVVPREALLTSVIALSNIYYTTLSLIFIHLTFITPFTTLLNPVSMYIHKFFSFHKCNDCSLILFDINACVCIFS